MGTGGILLGGNLAMDLHLIQEGVAIFGGLLFATETENKLRLCAPLPLRMLFPGGHSLSIYARFLGKKKTSLYISQEKMRSLFHPNTAQRFFFFPIAIFFKENLRKNWSEKRA